jgi:hypothetical protein
MKKLLSALIIAFALVGCAHQEPIKPSIIVEYKYVAAPIPEKHLEIPEPIQPLDFDKTPKPTQKDVAEWITKSELRTKKLEANINELKKHQDEQLKKQENKK